MQEVGQLKAREVQMSQQSTVCAQSIIRHLVGHGEATVRTMAMSKAAACKDEEMWFRGHNLGADCSEEQSVLQGVETTAQNRDLRSCWTTSSVRQPLPGAWAVPSIE